MSEHPKPLVIFAFSHLSPIEFSDFDALTPFADAVFVSTIQELFDSLRNPACFTVFYDRSFGEKSLDTLAIELKKRELPWTLIADKLTPADRDHYSKIGVYEILTYPINESLLIARCRLMLNRYLEMKDFPVEVNLPHDISVQALRTQKKQRDSFDGRKVSSINVASNEPTVPIRPAPTSTSTVRSEPRVSIHPTLPTEAKPVEIKAEAPVSMAVATPPTKENSKLPMRPGQLMGIVRSRVQEIRQDVPWDRGWWPSQKVPAHESQEAVVKGGFSQAVEEIASLFVDCLQVLNAHRITLISVRPDYGDPDQRFLGNLLAVASSDPAIANHPSVPSILFPQVQAGVEKKAAIILNEAVPELVPSQPRPEPWRVNGKVEEASVVIPLTANSDNVYAALLIQFDSRCDAEKIKMIEQAVSFLGLPKYHYRHVDFMGRIYREPV